MTVARAGDTATLLEETPGLVGPLQPDGEPNADPVAAVSRA
jgi:hypothetical protein